MGFFKDLKDDLSQAVNELLPDEESRQENLEAEDNMVNILDRDGELSNDNADNEKLKVWLEEYQPQIQQDGLPKDTEDFLDGEDAKDIEGTEDIEDIEDIEDTEDTEVIEDTKATEDTEVTEDTKATEDTKDTEYAIDTTEALKDTNDTFKRDNTKDLEKEEVYNMEDNVDLELLEGLNADEEPVVEEEKVVVAPKRAASVASEDEVSIITKGTVINGSISSDGSLDIMGNVTGDVDCLGKLSITGKVIGNSSAAEVFVNTERVEGSITSEGSVKVGLGTVIVGDVKGTSGVIAGAIKGEIDISGPIVIDSTAIIKGNIKAKSVQINNGAVIEGFCSLSYSDVDMDNIFE